jgi:hypothetical protein
VVSNAIEAIRIFSGPDGESRVETVEFSLPLPGPLGRRDSAWQPATGFFFRETAPGYCTPFHPASRRFCFINLAGQLEIEVGSGERRIVEPGDVVIAEDLQGAGHRSAVLGDQIRRSIFIGLD